MPESQDRFVPPFAVFLGEELIGSVAGQFVALDAIAVVIIKGRKERPISQHHDPDYGTPTDDHVPGAIRIII